MEAERRNITVMFCDLVGSTALSDQLDPEELHEIVQAYQEVCADEIEKLEGHIAQYLGDGILVYFGYPITHEDESQRAVRSGLRIIKSMEALNLKLRKERQIEVGVRIGIHTGLVVMADIGRGRKIERLALGITPNIAARVESVAESNTVAISESTHKSIEKYFECEDLGQHELKGLSVKMRIYKPLYEKSDEWSYSGDQVAANVGREHELGVLLTQWEAVVSGKPGSVLISGEAGIGKTHLIRTLMQHTAMEKNQILYGQSSPSHTHTAYYPMANMLKKLLDKDTGISLEVLEGWLAEYPIDLIEAVPLMATVFSISYESKYDLLSLSPKLIAKKIQELVMHILNAQSKGQPLMIILEDLQWVDPSTLKLLAGLQEGGVKALFIFTSRTKISDEAVSSNFMEIELQPLLEDEVVSLAEHLVRGKKLPKSINAQLIKKTGGVPLFIEELVRLILESGMLKENEEEFELLGPVSQVSIPVSLKDLINAKLDQLGPAKEVMQIAAVFRREFSRDLMESISKESAESLAEHLKRSIEGGLLLIKGQDPYYVFFFKHSLIQEEAYNLLIKSKRRDYHLSIANTLEIEFNHYAEENPDFMAYHLASAEANERALDYWQKADDQALRKSSNKEAIDFFQQGLALLPYLPDGPERDQKELLLQAGLAPALLTVYGYTYDKVEKAYARAQELCPMTEDMPRRATILRGLWSHYTVGSAHKKAAEVAISLKEVANKTSDVLISFEAAKARGGTYYWMGNFTEADQVLSEALQDFDPEIHYKHIYLFSDHPAVGGFCYWAMTLAILGRKEESKKKIQLAVDYARKLQHPFSIVYALSFAGIWALLLENRDEVINYAEEGLALATKYGFAFWQGITGIILAQTKLSNNRIQTDHLVKLGKNIETLRRAGATLWLSQPAGLLAEAYGKGGQPDRGLAVIEDTIRGIEKQQEMFFSAELYRIKSSLIEKNGAAQTGNPKYEGISCYYRMDSKSPIVCPSTGGCLIDHKDEQF